MRDYGAIHTSFWTNPDMQNLPGMAKLLAVYLLTEPHTNMLGCFRLPIGYVSTDLNWTNDRVLEAFKLLSANGFATYDQKSHWVFIHNYLKWNPIDNPNQGKSLQRLFEQVQQESNIYQPLVFSLLANPHYLSGGFKHRLETLAEPFRKGSETLPEPFRNQEQEQEQNQDPDQEPNQEQAKPT
jgi:hypothetical protein